MFIDLKFYLEDTEINLIFGFYLQLWEGVELPAWLFRLSSFILWDLFFAAQHSNVLLAIRKLHGHAVHHEPPIWLYEGSYHEAAACVECEVLVLQLYSQKIRAEN